MSLPGDRLTSDRSPGHHRSDRRVALSPRLRAIVDALPLRPGLRVIEIGCGPGAAAREVAGRLGPSGHVLAIDRSAKAIAQLEESARELISAGRLTARHVSAEQLELDPGEDRYDIAFAVRVGAFDGRHPDVGSLALLRLGRALVPGGRLYIDGGTPLREVVVPESGPVSARLFVVVSGPPASGKSTLAPVLARELGLPLVAKDTIKDALMSELAVPDVESSRQLGRAAVAAMLAVAAESPTGAVIESNFYRSAAAEGLRRLPGSVVEIFCRCSPETASHRYRARVGTRHAGHFDSVRSVDELWNDEVAEPVAGGWPLLEVNTDNPVDVAPVLAFIRDLRSP